MDRKQFIKTGLAGSAFLSLPLSTFSGTSGKLNILMLGGTNFVGPAFVREAQRRGHKVTLFNRGKTDPDLFPDLELIKGNRYPDRGAGLSGLQNNRKWDAVIDTWSREPGCVDATARMLKDRVDRYIYISSIATYRNYSQVGITEDGPLLEAGAHTGSFDSELSYPVRKRASEQVIEQRYGNRGTILRCTSILGYDGGKKDPASQSAAAYWGFRFLSNKPILVPDDPEAVIQYIDITDLSRFGVLAIENSFDGAYNLVGPERPLPLLSLLETWKEATNSSAKLIRVDTSFLEEQDISPFSDLPLWIPVDDSEPGFYQISNRRALNQGLTYRPLEETLEDIIYSLQPHTPDSISRGISRKRELEVLNAWKRHIQHD